MKIVHTRVAAATLFVLILAALTAFAQRRGQASTASAISVGKLDGDFADPFVLRAPDGYYAFATGARACHLQLATSTDLVTWTWRGEALPQLPSWAAESTSETWAPTVLARDNGYVLYYTTRDARSGFQCISRAVSSRPEGPYTDQSSRALICQVDADSRYCGSIDPSPFVDADGSAYLLWKSDENSLACKSRPRLWSQRLSRDGLQLVGSPHILIERDAAWEGDIIEAPSMLLYQGRHYLFYSANWYASSAYAIGYAVCTGPMSGCTKASVTAPLFGSSGPLLGPGGQEFFTAQDGRLWMAYHAWTSPATTYAEGGARSLRLAPVGFSSQGAPEMIATETRLARRP